MAIEESVGEVFPVKEHEEFWTCLADLAQKKGVHYGIPIGIFHLRITTNDPVLRGIKDAVDSTLHRSDSSKDLDAKIAQAAQELGISEEQFRARMHDIELEEKQWEVMNSWKTSYTWKGVRGLVEVLRHKETGRIKKRFTPFLSWARRWELFFKTALAHMEATLLSAEMRARDLLKLFLTEQQWASYMLSDAFFEPGKSGIMYILRKGRPTIALRQRQNDGDFHTICALCLHPLGYYTGTWAGVMPPSDEVYAHLVMIRGDEYEFWKQANQHSLDEVSSGI